MPTQYKRQRPIARKPRKPQPAAHQSTAPPLATQEADPLADLRLLTQVGHPSAGLLRQQAIQRLGLFGNQTLGGWLRHKIGLQANSLEEFMARGNMPDDKGKDLVTPTGLGGFNALFNPTDRTLYVRLNIAFDFQDGLVVDESNGLVGPNAAGLAGKNAAKQLTQLTAAAANLMSDIPDQEARIKEVKDKWQWKPTDLDPWMTEYRGIVQGAWGGKHHFRSKKWKDLLASVKVVVNVHAGAKQEGDHVNSLVVKVPDDFALGAVVRSGDKTKADDSTMIIGSAATKPASKLLHCQVFFEHDSHDLTKAKAAFADRPVSHRKDATAFLTEFIPTFKAADPNKATPIKLIGRASSVGNAAYNQTLSQKRSTEVEKFLEDNGLNGPAERTTASGEGETGATEKDDFRRVDILVGSGEGQVVAPHEVGHLLGLGDEYATGAGSLISGTGKPVGDKAKHDELASKMGGGIGGAVHENTDSMMSLGNTVRPQHYATFHYALENVTGESWEYAGEGDAPAPKAEAEDEAAKAGAP